VHGRLWGDGTEIEAGCQGVPFKCGMVHGRLWGDGTEIEEYTQAHDWDAGWETTMHRVTFDVY
jgi:hypothetical protein